MKSRKLLIRFAEGHMKNVRFRDVERLLEELGFERVRISGSHHIFTHPAATELVNIQNVRREAKPYQIKQIVNLIEKYGLAEGEL